jgi:NlpC/P60 family putative phage cell wall peptidase
MITRADVVNEARSWMGTRFHHQGDLKGVGCDCIGLLVGVSYQLGIVDARSGHRGGRFEGYGGDPDPVILLQACDAYLDPIRIFDAVAGDILLMRFVTEPQHFAIISNDSPRRIIHAYLSARRVVENDVDEVWGSRVVRAYSFRGVA